MGTISNRFYRYLKIWVRSRGRFSGKVPGVLKLGGQLPEDLGIGSRVFHIDQFVQTKYLLLGLMNHGFGLEL